MVSKSFTSKVFLKLRDGVSGNLKRITRNVGVMNTKFEKVNFTLGRMNRQISRSTNNMRRLAGAAKSTGASLTTKLSLPLTLGLAGAVRAFAVTEEGLADVRKNTGLAASELDKMNAGFSEFTENNRIGKKQLLEFASAAGQSGFTTRESIESASKAFAKFVVATDVTASDKSFRELVRTVNLLGLNAEKDLPKVSSTIAALGQKVEVAESEIVEFSSQIVSAFGGLKKSTPDLLALIAGVVAAKQNSESSATAFGVLGRSIEEAFKENGTLIDNFAFITGKKTPQAFMQLFRANPAKTFIEISKGINRAVKSGKNIEEVLDALNITSDRQRKVFKGLQETVGRTEKAVDVASQEFNNYNKIAGKTDAITKELNEKNKTTIGRLQIMKNKVSNAAEAFGKELQPVLFELLSAGTKILKWFNALSPETKKFLAFAAIGAALLGPLVAFFGQVGFAILGIKNAFMVLQALKILPFLGKLWAIGKGIAAVFASPLVLEFVAIAAAVTSVYIAIKKLVQVFQELNRVGNFFERAKLLGKSFFGGKLTDDETSILAGGKPLIRAKPRRVPIEQMQSLKKEEIIQKQQLKIFLPNTPKGTRVRSEGDAFPFEVFQGYQSVGP